ncbi:hypothetical protein EUTSA_v10012379mg [Eutrema salsugineum]|uniref:F-box domain-containing protein n=1 Tax=Eutrema salsugineum TaxID=72664 RepID=V4KT52_EUTSA|nr:F-box protein At1g31080 [Eutrema salsugineum]ESQ30528.1 hypothetical protein EUTSA_v10012379mg [Eutrema salsugineum]
MIRRENSDSIPTDLVNEILSRLHAKSIARFRCVSKLWSSMILRPYFTDLFLTRSSACPQRLLFAVQLDGDEWCFFTSSQPQNPYDEESSSSLVVTADRHMKFLGDEWLETCGYTSGLICFCRHKAISEVDKHTVICNPSTGQYASLPIPKKWTCWRRYLGFDPIGKQFKVSSLSCGEKGYQYEILTLGTGKFLWRKIHCPFNHFPEHHLHREICINGFLYYLAGYHNDERIDKHRYLVVCFDVRSEKFKFIYRDFILDGFLPELINYKGKLGVFTRTYSPPGTRNSIKLCLSVLKDVEKSEPEWSEYSYSCWQNQFPKCVVYDFWEYRIVGVTATSEIVFSTEDASRQSYVFFFNPQRNTLLSVEIQGFGAGTFEKRRRRVQVFLNYVEDLKFITMKTTNAVTPKQKSTSTTSSEAYQEQDGRRFESINKFDSLRLLDDDEFT